MKNIDDQDDELRGGMNESEARLDEHARARDDQHVWSSAPMLGVAMPFPCCYVFVCKAIEKPIS